MGEGFLIMHTPIYLFPQESKTVTITVSYDDTTWIWIQNRQINNQIIIKNTKLD